jgi:hypothetical protein
MSILVLTEQEIRQTVSMPKAMEAMEEAFAALARSKARLPDVIGLEVPEVNGEIHVGYNAKLSVSFSQTKPNGMFRRSVSQPQYIAGPGHESPRRSWSRTNHAKAKSTASCIRKVTDTFALYPFQKEG